MRVSSAAHTWKRDPQICPVCDRESHPMSSCRLCSDCFRATFREGKALVEASRDEALRRLREEFAEHAEAVTPPGNIRNGVPGFVYFLRREWLVKVGFSTNPKRRISNLGGGDLLALMPGYLADERALHARFGHLRVHDEWFAYTQELAEYIDAIAAEGAAS